MHRSHCAHMAMPSKISGVRDIIASATFDTRRVKRDYRGRGADEVAAAKKAALEASFEDASNGGRSPLPEMSLEKEKGDVNEPCTTSAVGPADVGQAELGGGNVCRSCGAPRFGRSVCSACGVNAKDWLAKRYGEAGSKGDGSAVRPGSCK